MVKSRCSQRKWEVEGSGHTIQWERVESSGYEYAVRWILVDNSE